MKVYWSEPWQHRIMRCTLNGADFELHPQRLSVTLEESDADLKQKLIFVQKFINSLFFKGKPYRIIPYACLVA